MPASASKSPELRTSGIYSGINSPIGYAAGLVMNSTTMLTTIKNGLRPATLLWLCLIAVAFATAQTEPYARPVPFTRVEICDDFWAPRILTNHQVTIPISIQKSRETGRIRNFMIAGRLEPGAFCSKYPFDDSDVFKIIEGAAYSLQLFPDARLEATLDTLISYIAAAQEPDGYLYTNRTIDSLNLHPFAGKKRWEKDPEHSHELYNMGHLYEAAVAHYQATGKRGLLDVAIKNADLVVKDFLQGGLPYYPGHQGIELALVRLYRITQNPDYLHLARYFLDIRQGGGVYNQSHLPVRQQREIVGHAVRGTYMYSGMADVAALTGDTAYQAAIRRIWGDMLEGKYYITGGIGSERSNEGFGEAYHLPNLSAYCETCASIGNVMWNYRMFLMDTVSMYVDVLERTLYNALLAGVSAGGDRFFYPNPLESDGSHERAEWFGCACCPSNICRFLPSLPGYVYATKGNRVYVNLYMQNNATLDVDAGPLKFGMQTRYPRDGRIVLKIADCPAEGVEFAFRIPGWANGQAVPSGLYAFTNSDVPPWGLKINGRDAEASLRNGYACIRRQWKSGDIIELNFEMPVQEVTSDERVIENTGRIVLQRGPLVYCLEWPDQSGHKPSDLKIDPAQGYDTFLSDEIFPGTVRIGGKAVLSTGNADESTQTGFVAIPYYQWANRGKGEMRVWLPLRP